MDAASGPVPDATVVIPDIAHIARTNNKAICLCHFAYGESPLSSLQQAGGYPAEDSYEGLYSRTNRAIIIDGS